MTIALRNSPTAFAQRIPRLLLRGLGPRRLRGLHGLEVELTAALEEEDAIRRLVATRRVLVVPAGLHQVGTRPKAKLRLPVRRLDERARHDHDLEVVGVRM